jgi:hypothetical protein
MTVPGIGPSRPRLDGPDAATGEYARGHMRHASASRSPSRMLRDARFEPLVSAFVVPAGEFCGDGYFDAQQPWIKCNSR